MRNNTSTSSHNINILHGFSYCKHYLQTSTMGMITHDAVMSPLLVCVYVPVQLVNNVAANVRIIFFIILSSVCYVGGPALSHYFDQI